MSRYVLCRRDRADFGAAPVYCCAPIKTPNVLNWCDDCRARLPLWPASDLMSEGINSDSDSGRALIAACNAGRDHQDAQIGLFAATVDQ